MDIFSFGTLLFVLACRRFPFKLKSIRDDETKDFHYQYLYDRNEGFKKFFRSHDASHLPYDLRLLIWACLNPTPEERPTIQQILTESKWLAGMSEIADEGIRAEFEKSSSKE